ncbi:MAG: hypothetical protein WDN10_02710 [bacterium]
MAGLRLRLQQCDTRLSRLTDALLDHLIEKQEYEAKKAALLGERRELLDKLESPEASRQPADGVLQALELPDVVETRYEMALPDQRRRIASAIAWNLTGSGKEAVPELKSPYREIVQWRLSNPVRRNGERSEPDIKLLYEALKEVCRREDKPPQRPQRPDVSGI